MNIKTAYIALRKIISIPIKLETYTETDSKKALFGFGVSLGTTRKLKYSGNFSASPLLSFAAQPLPVTRTIISASFAGLTWDSTGKSNGTVFSSTGKYLYIGNDGTQTTDARRAWIPFFVDFTINGSGVHITSACLVVTAAETISYTATRPCGIRVGCASTSSASPIAWNNSPVTGRNLSEKVFASSVFSGSITTSWIEGEEYNINITTPLKSIMGATLGADVDDKTTLKSTLSITWPTAGDYVNILITDKGSALGSYRSIISANEGVLPAPQLRIEYSNNVTEDNVTDTFISAVTNEEKNKVNYKNSRLYIGESTGTELTGTSYKTLMKFDTAVIAPTSTVTSATLYLYLAGNRASSSGNYFGAFRMMQDWDIYGASWNKRDGINLWATAGAASTSDCEHTPSGGRAISATESLGWKSFSITALVADWVTTPASNYGIMLRTYLNVAPYSYGTDNLHYFASSENATTSRYPYLNINYTDSNGVPLTKKIIKGG